MKVRLHIGRISEKLANDKEDLENRISKFGNILEPLELRKKDILDTYYGYLTIDTNNKKLQALRTQLNNINFKGSKLSVNIAKPDYKEIWEKKVKAPEPSKPQDDLKRLYSSKPREIDVIPGDQRDMRRDIHKATYKILKKGKPKIINCKKQKLWGFEKKPLELLVREYSNGQWKDSQGNTVETVDYSKLKEDVVGNDNERDAALNILDSMFGDESSADVKTVVFDDDDNDDVPMGAPHEDYEHRKIESSDEQEDDDGQDENNDPTSKKTDDFKSLYDDYQPSSGGGLFGSLDNKNDDEIDENAGFFDVPTVGELKETSKTTRQIDEEHVPRIREPRGLFFPHFESAFLSAQSQLNKIANTGFDKTQWEEEFWDKRGEWNRETRRRRRDVVRQLKKKNMAKGRVTS